MSTTPPEGPTPDPFAPPTSTPGGATPPPAGATPPATPYGAPSAPQTPEQPAPYTEGGAPSADAPGYGASPYASAPSTPYGAAPSSPYGQPTAAPQAPYGSPYGQPATPGTDGFAIASLVTGILGMGVVALVLGIVGLNRVKKSGQNGKGMSIAGIVLGAVGILVGIVWAIIIVVAIAGADDYGNLDTASGTSIVEETEAPADDEADAAEDAGTAGLAGTVATDAGFELGGCFDSPETGNVYDIDFVDCGQSHEFEVYAVDTFTEGAYPGDDAVANLAVDFCETSFADYVGTDWLESSLDYDAYFPDGDSWEQGDRELACYAYTQDGEALTSSVKGSGL